jgi:YjbE family integral membrane protein
VSVESDFLPRLLGIVLIDIALAGDNALVIALAVRSLPARQQFWGRVGGSFGAVALRLIFLAIATALLRVPLLQFAGGAMLIWIAVKLVRPATGGEHHVRGGTSLWTAIWIIVVADAVMSFDNVLGVAGAAHGDFVLIVFGIAISLPLVVWGSALLGKLMARAPWLVWVAGGVLGYVAGEMMLHDRIIVGWIGELGAGAKAVSALLAAVMIFLGWQHDRRRAAEATAVNLPSAHRSG